MTPAFLATISFPPASPFDHGLPPPGDSFAIGGVLMFPRAEVWVGRYGPEAGINLTLPSMGVSRYHAVFRPAGKGWVLEDLKSRNHTVHNQKVISQQIVALNDGDTIQFLDFVFAFGLGKPFDRWMTEDVMAIARSIHRARQFDSLPILGDALRDAGCEWEPILDACDPVRRVFRPDWAVELLLRWSGELPFPPRMISEAVDITRRVRNELPV